MRSSLASSDHASRGARAAVGVVAALFAVACGADGGDRTDTPGPLAHRFATAAAQANVSRELMIAIAAVEGGLTMPRHREVDVDAAVPVAGPLELRHGRFDSLARGAALMGTSELALRQDADLALDASARVLAEVGTRLGASSGASDDLASWSAALEEMSGYLDAAHRRHYAHRVFALLARGGSFAARDGETLTLAPHAVPWELTVDLSDSVRIASGAADYGPAEWFPTPSTNKWTAGRPNGAVDRIVIHDTEGGWDASVSTLQNDPNKSVHYIVGQDGRVGQFVHESDTAWHAGNWFYNTKSVGIEHVGYSTQPYPDAQYAASAALVKYLAATYNIPKDRTHIVGHDQIPNGNVMAEDSPPCEESPATCETGSSYGGSGNHRDPGDWEWCLYMVERVGGTCKCNDIWSLWNCASDKTEAFRCTGGKVEIEHCDGPGACESMPNGVDDVCHVAAAPDAGAGASAEAGTGTGASVDAGANAGVGVGVGVDGGGVSVGVGEAPTDASAGSNGGCGVARSGSSGGAWGAALAGAVAIAMAARRKRSREAR